jgi:trans-L-3-hydroxyproline dehydratase
MTSCFDNWNWQPPASWHRLATVDMHTGGEPLRIFTAGLPPIQGESVLEKRRFFREHYDYIRTGALWEPRGHADMYGAVLMPSNQADFDVFFLHNEGYSTMCGHAIIALTTLLVETGLRAPKNGSEVQLTFQVPAGLVRARATFHGGKARDVSFENVPSFLYLQGEQIEVPGLGRVSFDVAYGGAFYALVDARSLGLTLVPGEFPQLVDYGRRIKQAVMSRVKMEHPFEPELSFLYGTIFTGPPLESGRHSRNVCIFADGELDRSPTGSGVSARAASHHARGELRLNETITIESILGSVMTVRAVAETTYGRHAAVVPEVGGTAFVTGRNEFYFDPEDPFGKGFIFR